jgi:hypothetical protein
MVFLETVETCVIEAHYTVLNLRDFMTCLAILVEMKAFANSDRNATASTVELEFVLVSSLSNPHHCSSGKACFL